MKWFLSILFSLTVTLCGQEVMFKRSRAFTQVSAGTGDATLRCWYKFDEGTGTNAFDSSGYGNTAALYGSPSWESGKVGTGSLYFDANTKYGEIANIGTALDGTNITVLAWINATNLANTYPRIVDRVYNGQYTFYLTAGGAVQVLSGALKTAGGTGDLGGSGVSGAIIATNVWMHVGWVWNGTKLQAYTNGVKCVETTVGTCSGGLASSSSITRIAQRADSGGNRGFTGWIDDLRVYSRALSDSDVDAIYQATK